MDSLQYLVALVTLFSLILLPNFQFTSSKKTTNLSLKLIHRDSPESPLYPGAMSFRERVERYMKISESRMKMHNRSIQPNMMRPLVGSDGFLYLVKLEIGSSANNSYYLIFDTGSGLTWLQCQPCQECFPQQDGYNIYDPKQSQTFKQVPCDNPVCQNFNCTNDHCMYTLNYMDGSSSQGYAAWETFHIKDREGIYTHLNDILFGCSNLNKGFVDTPQKMKTGIVGMDRSQYSFITQIGSLIMKRFSYCLVNPFIEGAAGFSYLRFGTDVGFTGGNVQRTPFEEIPGSTAYGLNLLDISVNNTRLNYPPKTFQARFGGGGGFIIDSGSSLSYIEDSAYQKLEAEFVRYFSAFKEIQKIETCPPPTKLCYNAPGGFSLFPSVTYHFDGADLTIEPQNNFITFDEIKMFTLAIAPSTGSILGSYQQHNYRFVYDLDLNLLVFSPENCNQDPPLI